MQPVAVPEQMQCAAQQQPALAAKLEAHETWLVRTFGVPIEYRYDTDCRFTPAWLGETPPHRIYFTQGAALDSFLWEWACFLTALTLQGEAIQARGWLPYFGPLSLGAVCELHRQHGFVKVASSRRRQGRDLATVIAKQFRLIQQIPLVLGRTVLHMSLEARLARDFPEINCHVSPLRRKHWDPGAHAKFKEAMTELLPVRIARRWWSVKAARALLLDRLMGTRHEDLFAGFGGGKLARTIADYCRGALAQMPPGGEYEIMRRVGQLARLQDFENPQQVPVTLFRAAP